MIIIALGGFAAFHQYQNYQRRQGANAAAMYDDLEQAAQAGDLKKVESRLGDLRKEYPSTVAAEQGGLLAAKVQFEAGQPEAARATLEWVAANATEKEYKVLAGLRLAGLLLDQKKPDEALKALPAEVPPSFKGLLEDRRGDILHAQGKHAEARAAYQAALAALDPRLDYRRLVEAKMTSLGATAPAEAASAVARASAAAASVPAAAAAEAAAAASATAPAASGASR